MSWNSKSPYIFSDQLSVVERMLVCISVKACIETNTNLKLVLCQRMSMLFDCSGATSVYFSLAINLVRKMAISSIEHFLSHF